MDPARFDGFTRALGGTASRRAALAALLAGAVAPLLHSEDAGAGRRGKRRNRRQGSKASSPPPQGAACDVCDKDCRFSDLKSAIDAANPGDTIRICAGTYKSGPAIYINKPLTLVGAGAKQTVLKGGGFVRVLEIGPSGPVTLRDLAIAGGLEKQKQRLGGAGILIFERGTLTLERCLVEDNVAAEGGGIMVSFASTLNLIDSEVSGNTAFGIGGGVVVREGARALLERSRVGDNNVKVWGAGIFNDGLLTVTSGSRIDRNKAGGNGGGIYATRGSTVRLEGGSLVAENKGAEGGGGILNDRAEVIIADPSIVVDNAPDNCLGRFGAQTANCVN